MRFYNREKEIGSLKAIQKLSKTLRESANMPRKESIESVRRHRQWQKMLNKNKFFDEIFEK